MVSTPSAALYHWQIILPTVVKCITWGLRRALGLSGPAGIGTAANIFVGMVEAPLLGRPHIDRMSCADLLVVMTAGSATIAGTMMVFPENPRSTAR